MFSRGTHLLRAVLLLFVLITLTACETSNPPTATPGGDEGIQVTISTEPSPPKAGNVTVTFTVLDSAGKPVTDADTQVHIKIDMPTMNHRPIVGDATYVGDGKWQAAGLFSMGGEWRALVTVTRNGQTVATREVRMQVGS